MKRIYAGFFGALLVVLGAGPAAAQFAQGDDPLLVQPEVFVIIDTSGSMDWGRTDGLSNSDLYPCGTLVEDTSTPDPDDMIGSMECDRKDATKQVLTGTFTTTAGDCSNQDDDGILDLYQDQVRFGFSTFDNHRDLDSYDYADDTDSTEQLGIRNRTSTMVDLVNPSDPENLLGNNQNVQAAACTANASGGTPLAAALHDARYYFANWEAETGYNDPVDHCRARFILLMTDGVDSNYSGYDHPTQYAYESFHDDGIPVIVVAFGSGSSGANAIALAGGTLQAFAADDPVELFVAFSAAMDAILAGSTSRTEVVSSGSDVSFSTSHQYAAYFDITQSGLGWKGHLIQLPVNGVDENGVPEYGPDADIIRFENELAAMTAAERNIYTVINDPRSQAYDWNVLSSGFDNSELPRYFDDGDPVNGMVSFQAGMHDAAMAPWMCGAASAAERDLIRDWVKGVVGTPSSGGQYLSEGPYLGDIFHSTPVVAKPPTALSPDFRYELYFRRNVSRDTMVYVGANDGMLHAFVAEDNDNSGDLGKEAWGFIPSNLLAKIHRVRMTHDTFVDGSPIVRDVFFNNMVTLRQDDTPYDMGAYRTVLFSGERGGGDAYFALDVTDPHNPGYLWEYRTGVASSADYATVQCKQGLMESWAQPVVGQVWLKNEHFTSDADRYISRSVMIVPGGYVPAAKLMDFTNCVDFAETMISASSLHVVDVETGKLLKKFQFGDGLEASAEVLLDQYYAELEDCEVNGVCVPFNHIGVGNRFSGDGWFCGVNRQGIRNPPYVPPELLDHCTVYEDDVVYRKECCYHDGPGPCNFSAVNSCSYLYEKKKNVPGGLRIKIKTEGCSLVPDVDKRGRIEFEVEDDIWLESVAAKPVAYNTSLGEYLSRVFVPTTTGKVWRVDLSRALYNHEGIENPTSDSDRLIKEYDVGPVDYCWDVTRENDGHCNPAEAPMAWFNMLVDDTANSPTQARPFMVSPTLAMDYNRELLLFVGTGFTDNLEYTPSQDYFYAIREARKTDSAELEARGQLVDQMAFAQQSERLFGKPLVAGGNVFFTTYTPSTNDCLPGAGQLYGVNFTDFESIQNPISTPIFLGTGTPSSPSLTMTSDGPAVGIQMDDSIKFVDMGDALKSKTKGLHWGKVL